MTLKITGDAAFTSGTVNTGVDLWRTNTATYAEAAEFSVDGSVTGYDTLQVVTIGGHQVGINDEECRRPRQAMGKGRPSRTAGSPPATNRLAWAGKTPSGSVLQSNRSAV